MTTSNHSARKKNEPQTFNNKTDEGSSRKAKSGELISEEKHSSPIGINDSREGLSLSAVLITHETKESSKEKEKVAEAYNSKLRERGKETPRKELEKTINCHHCHDIALITKVLTCSDKLCHESYCFNCVKTHYIPFSEKTPLASLKRSSSNGKWICFKCNSKCLCLKCIPLLKKKVVRPVPHEIFLYPSSSSPTCQKSNKQSTTFKTELISKEQEQDSPNSNELDCKILKLKDEALIMSLNTYSRPMKINTSAVDTKLTKKKTKRSKAEATSPTNKGDEETKVLDSKLQQLVRQCEGYFYEQSKRKSFFKKTCLFCKGQCFNTNELLYFRYLKDFLQYVNYLFKYNPVIIYDKAIAEENKEILLNDMKELNGAKNKEDWHFSQPKVSCKGCLMMLLNKCDGIDVLRKVLMDKKDKKRDNSDKEREMEQENDIKLQTKDINEQIARDRKRCKEEEALANANVFNKAFNKHQDVAGPSTQVSYPIEATKHSSSKQREKEPSLKLNREKSPSSANPFPYHVPVYVPDLFPQHFQDIFNEILLSYQDLIANTSFINQQSQEICLSLDSINSVYFMIERLVKKHYSKEQEIIQKMFHCRAMLFSFTSYLYYMCVMNQNSSKGVFDGLVGLKKKCDAEFDVYNQLMSQVMQALDFFRKLSHEYLEALKLQHCIIENLSSIR